MDAIIQKIFPILGVLMIAGGLGYFLYTGFWEQVGKPGRLAAGFLTGALAILAGYNFQEKLKSFSDTIIGGGILMLYVTLIYGGRFETAENINQIIPEGFALLVAAVFSAAVAFYARERQSSQILAVGMLGAYLTPFWLGQVGDFDSYGVSYLGVMLYFLAINVALMFASFKMRAFGLMNLNSLGLFIGTLSLSGLMGDGMAQHPVLVPVVAFLIIVAQVVFATQTVDQFQKEHKTLTVSSLYFLAPFFWIVTVLFGAFDSSETLALVGEYFSLTSILMVGVAGLYFWAWHQLEKNEAISQTFNSVIYVLGFAALALSLREISEFFVGYVGLMIAVVAWVFALLNIFAPKRVRELAFLATSGLAVVVTLSDVISGSAEISGNFWVFDMEKVFMSLSLVPFLFHFGMKKDEESELFHLRKILAYGAGILIAFLLGGDVFEYFDLRKDFLFFTLPAIVLAVVAWNKQEQKEQMFQYTAGSLTLLALGYFATFFALWDKLFPAHRDLPFSSFEGVMGFISLLVAGVLYVLVKKNDAEKNGYTDVAFSATVVLIIVAFQFVSYEIIALYNVVVPPVAEISAYVDDASVLGLRALLISFWWVALASGLIYAGIQNSQKFLHEKRIGMLLLALALGKILFYDIAHLDTNLKVLLFIITGSLVLGLSYMLNKKNNSLSA